MIKQLTFLVFISLFLFSCEEKETVKLEEPKNPLYEQLVGNYRATIISTEELIDINGDGTFSNNVLSEFGEQLNPSKNRLEIKPNQLTGKELLLITFPSFDPQTFPLENMIISAISLGGEYVIKDNFLISEDERISSIELIDLNTLEVKGKMDYYTRQGLQQITYTALYERR